MSQYPNQYSLFRDTSVVNSIQYVISESNEYQQDQTELDLKEELDKAFPQSLLHSEKNIPSSLLHSEKNIPHKKDKNKLGTFSSNQSPLHKVLKSQNFNFQMPIQKSPVSNISKNIGISRIVKKRKQESAVKKTHHTPTPKRKSKVKTINFSSKSPKYTKVSPSGGFKKNQSASDTSNQIYKTKGNRAHYISPITLKSSRHKRKIAAIVSGGSIKIRGSNMNKESGLKNYSHRQMRLKDSSNSGFKLCNTLENVLDTSHKEKPKKVRKMDKLGNQLHKLKLLVTERRRLRKSNSPLRKKTSKHIINSARLHVRKDNPKQKNTLELRKVIKNSSAENNLLYESDVLPKEIKESFKCNRQDLNYNTNIKVGEFNTPDEAKKVRKLNTTQAHDQSNQEIFCHKNRLESKRVNSNQDTPNKEDALGTPKFEFRKINGDSIAQNSQNQGQAIINSEISKFKKQPDFKRNLKSTHIPRINFDQANSESSGGLNSEDQLHSNGITEQKIYNIPLDQFHRKAFDYKLSLNQHKSGLKKSRVSKHGGVSTFQELEEEQQQIYLMKNDSKDSDDISYPTPAFTFNNLTTPSLKLQLSSKDSQNYSIQNQDTDRSLKTENGTRYNLKGKYRKGESTDRGRGMEEEFSSEISYGSPQTMKARIDISNKVKKNGLQMSKFCEQPKFRKYAPTFTREINSKNKQSSKGRKKGRKPKRESVFSILKKSNQVRS